jgi:hypothetical protein
MYSVKFVREEDARLVEELLPKVGARPMEEHVQVSLPPAKHVSRQETSGVEQETRGFSNCACFRDGGLNQNIYLVCTVHTVHTNGVNVVHFYCFVLRKDHLCMH